MMVERLFFVFLFIISMFFFIDSFSLSFYSKTGVFGPGFYPRVISVVLLVLIGYYLITNLIIKKVVNNHREKKEENKNIIINQLMLIISLFVCFGLIYIIGIFPSATLFMLFSLIKMQKIPWKKSIAITSVTMLILFGVFDYWLNIPFPTGIF